MGIEVTGILAFVILVLDLWAIISTIGSPISVGGKVLWVLLIFMLPVIGFVIWVLAGPRSNRTSAV